jgi:BirA family biotin operon repressor/biotin-[acetyl-CoA-carboxylase] ligase
LYPDDVPPALRPLIVFAGALALYRVLDDLRLSPTLHWPSQLRIGDRIVGGVRTDAHDLHGPVALGAGVYVGLSRHEIPASHRGRITSVAIAGSRADRMEIFIRFQDHLRRLYRQLEDDPEVLLASYRAACSTLGRRVRVESHGSPVEGLAVDLDPDGRLVLDTGDRLTGPVTVVGPPRARSALRVCVPILGMSVLSASGVVCSRRLRRALTAGR